MGKPSAESPKAKMTIGEGFGEWGVFVVDGKASKIISAYD